MKDSVLMTEWKRIEAHSRHREEARKAYAKSRFKKDFEKHLYKFITGEVLSI